MKCKYRHGEEWIEGRIESIGPNRVVLECPSDRSKSIDIHEAETHFYAFELTVSGYKPLGDLNYRIVSVDVRISGEEA